MGGTALTGVERQRQLCRGQAAGGPVSPATDPRAGAVEAAPPGPGAAATVSSGPPAPGATALSGLVGALAARGGRGSVLPPPGRPQRPPGGSGRATPCSARAGPGPLRRPLRTVT